MKVVQPVIHSINDLNRFIRAGSRPLCLFSGGLDGSYILAKLKEIKNVYPVALTIDLGGEEDVQQAEGIANILGAKSILIDKQDDFAKEYIAPSIAAQAFYLGTHPISASLSRPLLAKTAIEVARAENCDIILHTANPSQNSLRRFNGALQGLGYQGYYGSPYERESITREEKSRALLALGVDAFQKRRFSVDSNLWCREFESGDLDNIENFKWPEEMFHWTQYISGVEERDLSIRFEEGLPVEVDGEALGLVDLIRRLNWIGGRYMLGRYTGLEEIEGGMKFQEIREMPGAFLLLDGYRRIESACISGECIREKMHQEQLWVREALEGRWFHPLKEAAQNFIQSLAKRVSGKLDYKLKLRTAELRSIKVAHPLYGRDREQYEKDLNGQHQLEGLPVSVKNVA